MAKKRYNENNFVNLKHSDLYSHLYRVFKIDRLFDVFRTSQLTLVKPSLWDDPFENYLLKAENNLKPITERSFKYRDEYYGQCWTNISENDALWRIYAPEKNGVLVKVSINTLVQSFLDSHAKDWQAKCFVGNVEYKYQNQLLASIVDRDKLIDEDEILLYQANSLFIKRKEFSHEKEFRIILHQPSISNDNLYKFEFDPFENFYELLFDPRMDNNCYLAFKDYLVKLGYPSNQIKKSTLYHFPSNPEKLLEISKRFYKSALPVIKESK